MFLTGLTNDLWSLLSLVVLAVTIFALVTAITFPAEAYEAAGKLSKLAWVAILALAVPVMFLFGVRSLFGIGFVIAVLVYLVDVRPAIRGLRRR
ncbi:DUF2516 family protein [Nocardioides bruguierae]|uniref:DUF2516 family protein n=1 Tax=Nocardioides bruguierae TaxID=2945102 RepID=A0A9X2D9N6_9ACTN|nr:DUF2516 family protein [Nocardioides bruguierae]MCL8026256.1 DUF2516 family protein [Nocardioides bruguierae]MCM0621852.1 DUF2516 family protein [Nocardioides bruguierae]